MIVEISCIFLVYSYKHEVRLIDCQLYLKIFPKKTLFHKYKILTHANTLFKKFISEYADDGDIRYLVDTIQSDVNSNKFIFKFKL